MNEHLAVLLSDYDLDPEADDCNQQEQVGPFVMVENNVGGSEPPWYVTSHDTAKAAVEHNANQEYAEDWIVERIVDIRDGAEWEPAITYDARKL